MERGRQHSPRRQPQQPEHRRRAGKPEAHEGKNKYSKEALKQDITDIETQAQLLERAGEAAEKKRDFEAAEKHFLEAARLMGEAQALKRRTFKASQSRNKNYARHMGQQQGRGARAQHHSSVVIGATMRHYAQDTESYRTAAGDDDDDDVGDDGASMAQQDPDGYDDDGEPIPPQPIEDEVEVLGKFSFLSDERRCVCACLCLCMCMCLCLCLCVCWTDLLSLFAWLPLQTRS